MKYEQVLIGVVIGFACAGACFLHRDNYTLQVSQGLAIKLDKRDGEAWYMRQGQWVRMTSYEPADPLGIESTNFHVIYDVPKQMYPN